MKLRTHYFSRTVFSVVCVLLWGHASFADPAFVSTYRSACTQTLVPGPVTQLRKISEIKELRVGTYNVLNLYLQVGHHEYTGSRTLTLTKPSRDKPHDQLVGVAKAITESSPDILVVQEVESLESLTNFADEYLDGAYSPLLIQGNDPRGIQIGFLLKKDLPFKYELRSYRDVMWVDPVGEQAGQSSPVFSRDYPALIVRSTDPQVGDDPVLVLFGVHFKSKRDRPGDPEGSILRGAQVDYAVGITRAVEQEFGPSVPFFIAGDFNGASNIESEYRDFWELLHYDDAFNVVEPRSSRTQRITHTFHPRTGMRRASQLDAILVSPSAQKGVESVQVYRYKDPQTGVERPIPDTYDERSQNPSDHFLVYTRLKFQELLKARKNAH